jgi:ankyrin repeat protein
VQALVEGEHNEAFVESVDGANTMHYAAALGHVELLRYLIALPGASDAIKKQNSEGMSPLSKAAQANQLECVREMLAHGAGRHHQSTAGGIAPTSGVEPVHAAAKMGAMATLQFLIECEPMMIEYRNQNGASAAHFAAASGQDDVLKFAYNKLDALPADRQHAALRDEAGRTPVYRALLPLVAPAGVEFRCVIQYHASRMIPSLTAVTVDSATTLRALCGNERPNHELCHYADAATHH